MEDVENTSPKSAKSGDGAPKREKGWSAINKVNKELKEKKRENEKLQARVVEVSGAMDGLRQQLWELELVNAEAAARVEELEDAATARDAKSSEAEDQLLDAGAAEVAAAVADERARAAVERRALEAAHLAAVAELEAARLAPRVRARAAELQRRAAELQDARKAALDSNWRATQLEAELKTLRETKDATKKRLSVLDAQTQQARLAAEESRALLRGPRATSRRRPTTSRAPSRPSSTSTRRAGTAPRAARAARGPRAAPGRRRPRDLRPPRG
ncbi:hypothetical protein JL721_3978 [Aureococcus anophagefferens]|nr:hypothetical protein JL721_3978 [Aureococcus anophagefferens]